VWADAQRSGVPDLVLEAAIKSPVYRYVQEYRLALPLHPEFRTLPCSLRAAAPAGHCQPAGKVGHRLAEDMFSSLESARLPLHYMAGLLAAGVAAPIVQAYKVQMAVRLYKRAQSVGDVASLEATQALKKRRSPPSRLKRSIN